MFGRSYWHVLRVFVVIAYEYSISQDLRIKLPLLLMVDLGLASILDQILQVFDFYLFQIVGLLLFINLPLEIIILHKYELFFISQLVELQLGFLDLLFLSAKQIGGYGHGLFQIDSLLLHLLLFDRVLFLSYIKLLTVIPDIVFQLLKFSISQK